MTARVVWITGLSGAGKTTVAEKLAQQLRQAGIPFVGLDGDRLRAIFGEDLGHSPAERLRLALRYARLCRELASQDLTVVCATISLFHEVHRWNRENIPGYCEVYLRVPLAECARRDPKGLYARRGANEITDLVGLDSRPEEPLAADLVIDNHGGIGPDEAADMIWQAISAA
ncbi:MAG: adenylyl-sulfate kinase [Alphaproteobacteria bacterium]